MGSVPGINKRVRRKRPGRRKVYRLEVELVLKEIWLPFYEQEEGVLPRRLPEKVLHLSAPTIDQLIWPVWVKHVSLW